jgi:Tfp pilus assembly protein PilO
MDHIPEVLNSAQQINNDTSLIAWLAAVMVIGLIVFVTIIMRWVMKMNAETAARTEARNQQMSRSESNQAVIAANLAQCSKTLDSVNRSLEDLRTVLLES